MGQKNSTMQHAGFCIVQCQQCGWVGGVGGTHARLDSVQMAKLRSIRIAGVNPMTLAKRDSHDFPSSYPHV